MSMLQLKLKLTIWEAAAVSTYIEKLISTHILNQLDIIVLAEFHMKGTFVNAIFKNRVKPRNSLCVYSLPLSVAHVLHKRWQHEEIPSPAQEVLRKIDQALVNMNY